MIAIHARGPRRIGRRSVAVFCMPETGHFHRMESLIADLARSGIVVNVFTHRRFEPLVENAGGIFFDLFSKYPLEKADDASFPVPCRFVSFAGTYAKQISHDVEKTRPSLVIHDGFAVIGRVVASLLGIPRVNVCAGHNVNPAHFLAQLQVDPRVKISDRCLQAVEKLRESYDMPDASPFSYVSSLSPHLNIYCEPPEFLEEDERKPFEPLAFYGSLPSLVEVESRRQVSRVRVGANVARTLRVYVSFGTVVWRSYTPAALSALASLVSFFARMENLHVTISLGATPVANEVLARLIRPNVAVESYVDQWRILQEVDLFFTHHGMNSTHEAIFHRVPMVSYPFFWDQPALAAKCQRFGLAIPLTDSLRGSLSEQDVCAALTRFSNEKDVMRAALSRAREWELAVMENRPAVRKRVMDIIQ